MSFVVVVVILCFIFFKFFFCWSLGVQLTFLVHSKAVAPSIFETFELV